jgi:23S rRNA (cytidine1920-2'-O)/16S rRNA (cytidine1409-2'-O)-methyltransferase
VTRRRLDAELARRGLARSRQHAQGLIADGSVAVKGVVSLKAATMVDAADPIDLRGTEQQFVSRGAIKLIGALDAFADLRVQGRLALDAGASTGGFTEVLLHRGVSRVIAMDVGYGQLAWSLRIDPRVEVIERTNVRYASAGDLPWMPDLVVADLSFISLRTVLPALIDCSTELADLVLLVKPQFEVGKDQIADGVVRDAALRRDAVIGVASSAMSAGLTIRGVIASPLPGPRGNVEYFLWAAKGGEVNRHLDDGEDCRRGKEGGPERIRNLVNLAIETGPA